MLNNLLDINNQTKSQIKYLRFLDLKNDILGENYSLTINLLDKKSAKKLNQKTRNKDYEPDTLSFIYTKNSGEIVLTPEIVKIKAKEFNHTFKEHMLFLSIHSLLHLKGLDHSRKMEELESKYFKKYKKLL